MKRGLPLDRGIESTFPARAAAPSLPDRLRVVTFNVHGEPGDVIADALRSDRALRDADLIVLEEVHRADRAGDWCSGACRLARELGFHAGRPHRGCFSVRALPARGCLKSGNRTLPDKQPGVAPRNQPVGVFASDAWSLRGCRRRAYRVSSPAVRTLAVCEVLRFLACSSPWSDSS